MKRYAVSPDSASAMLEDGAVVLNMRTKRYYSLNETGATIWRLLEDDCPVGQIVAHLVHDYEVDQNVAGNAVSTLLCDLTREALITAQPE